LRLHISVRIRNIFTTVKSQRNSTRNTKLEGVIDYSNKYGIIRHQRCVMGSETKLFPDGTHKAVFRENKTSLNEETQLFTATHTIYSHSHNLQLLTQFTVTHTIYSHSHNLQPLTQFTATHTIYSHSHNLKSLTQFTASHTIYSHSHNLQSLTQFSHSHNLVTHTIYSHSHNLQSLTQFTVTHTIYSHSHNLQSHFIDQGIIQ
jgi:hypothetical protein